MTPLESWINGLNKSQENGCETNPSTQVRRDYEEKADEADSRLREKQEREWRGF